MRVAAFFCMRLMGHLHRTLPLVSRLAATGVRVVAFTHADFRREVEAAGAEHFDMLGRFPLEGVDDATTPRSVRYVTYAAHYGNAIAGEVRRLGASLVLCLAVAWLGVPVVVTLGLCLATLGSLSPAFSPSRCRLDALGAGRRGPFGWERRRWPEIRRAVAGRRAIVLSPHARPHWLDAFHALVLPLPTREAAPDPEQVRHVLERHGSA